MHPTRPRVSGKGSALLIGVCLVLSAVLLPTAAHLPHWVEFELVLGIWWIVWFVLLSWMLFQGHEVEDDAGPPRPRLIKRIFGDADRYASTDPLGCVTNGCLTGCDEAGLYLIALGLIILAAILLMELLIPGIAFLIYLAIRGMVARVINDRHHCAGETGMSMLWGIIWATVYTAPVAAIIYAVHWWVLHKGA